MAKIIMDENETVNEAVEVENTEAPELDADFSVDADSVENTSTDTEPPTDGSGIDTDMSVETPEETIPTDKEESSDNTQAEGNPDENIDNSGDDGITSLPLDDADLKPVYDEATGQADSVGVGKKWTDGYTIKKKPSDDDEAMILSTSEKANKRIKFSGIWDWIVDKMATAVVSKLTTTDKTVLGAINELNSKALKPFYSGYISNTPLKIRMETGLYIITTYRYGGYKISSLSVLNIQSENGSFLETLVKGENYDTTVKMDCTENELSANYKINLSGSCAIKIYKVCQ